MSFCQHIEAQQLAKDFNLWHCQNIDCDKYFYKKGTTTMENNDDKLTIGKLQINLQMAELRFSQLLENWRRIEANLLKIGVEIGEDFEIILRQEFFDKRDSDGAER